MKFASRLFASAVSLLAFSLVTPAAFSARTDRTFNTPSTLVTEIRTFVRLLEEVHYNRDAVKPSDYAKLIPDYMGELDGQKLFFLKGDRDEMLGRFPADRLYWNISALGKIEYAFEIFNTYESRAHDRISWIFEELKRDIDLASSEVYTFDRSKAEWPATAEEADDLWRKRLKFELVSEVLNKKDLAPEKALEEAKNSVRKRYERMLKNVAEIEPLDLAEMFLSTLARLYDPHSNYLSADTFEDFNISMRLQLVGIGAILSLEEDHCIVREIVPGGPADLSKQIKPNDKIIAVGQLGAEPVEVIGMKLRRIVDMIRGNKGTQVRLLVQPGDATDSSVRKEVVLTRDVVKLDSARAFGAIFEVPDAQGNIAPIGVITLPSFYGPDGAPDGAATEKTSATRDVAKLIEQMQAAGIKGLVLDLRRNGGGLLTEAIELTGLFIEKGPVVQVRSYYGEVKVDEDEDTRVAYNGPLAVLVSRFSASASEIVAGALQNYGRAIVVGDSSTHGKGTVQTIVEMKNVIPALARAPVKTGATKLTVQKFYLPSGSSTQLRGVVPDITLPSVEDYLPIGEKDLPHALVWDEIQTSLFEGKPLGESAVKPLREASLARQEQLEEFSFLRRNIEFFKEKQAQKTVSLNLDERRRQKEADDAFRKELEAEKKRLAKTDFAFREFLLAPPPAPRITAPAPEANQDADATDLSTDEEPNGHYGKLDIHLRESLRVLADVLASQGSRHELAAEAGTHTASTDKKS